MGYIKHTAIVMTSWDAAHLKPALRKAKALGLEASEPVESRVNGYHTAMIAPHGSKMGWIDQEEADRSRSKFITWLKSKDIHLEWFSAEYGRDDASAEVVDSAWNEE